MGEAQSLYDICSTSLDERQLPPANLLLWFRVFFRKEKRSKLISADLKVDFRDWFFVSFPALTLGPKQERHGHAVMPETIHLWRAHVEFQGFSLEWQNSPCSCSFFPPDSFMLFSLTHGEHALDSWLNFKRSNCRQKWLFPRMWLRFRSFCWKEREWNRFIRTNFWDSDFEFFEEKDYQYQNTYVYLQKNNKWKYIIFNFAIKYTSWIVVN